MLTQLAILRRLSSRTCKPLVYLDLHVHFTTSFPTPILAECREMNGHPDVSRYADAQFARYQTARRAQSGVFFGWYLEAHAGEVVASFSFGRKPDDIKRAWKQRWNSSEEATECWYCQGSQANES